MPSGSRKRKAAKKKGGNGSGSGRTQNTSSSNSSSTHSQEGEDPRSLDDRESDSGEIRREEEARIVGYEEGRVTIDKGLSEEIAGTTQYEKNGSRVFDVAEDTPIVIHSSEDKEVAVEEVNLMGAEKEDLKAVDVNSVVDLKAAELLENIVSLPQEENVGFGSPVAPELADSKLVEGAILALPVSEEKEKLSSISDELKSEKVETKFVAKDEEKSTVAPPADTDPKSGLDTVKILETSNAPAVTKTTQVEDNVKDASTQKRSSDETSVVTNPLPVQRTSMMGCCGLFELFSGANR